MRKYISSDELYTTLQQILEKNNPELLTIYRSILHYRLAQSALDQKRCAQIEKMLQMPQKTVLALLNMVLLPIVCTVFVCTVYNRMPEYLSITSVVAFLGFTLFEAWRFSRLAARLSQCRPYVLIDELFARKILVVRHGTSKTAKAAK
ncbi:hypothetical protein IM774_08920 [Erysipelotrichaceae bacterium RD49]|nr:hypothetical protein [Erysipelotrichaceae bacterium RD49]